MIAVDTNVVVRFLTADDTEQFRQSTELFQTRDTFIPDTVILETEWVLRFAYKYDRAQIGEALRHLCGLRRVSLHNPTTVALALGWYAEGLDFADAMHLAGSQHCSELVTFDRRFIARSQHLESVAVSLPQ